MVTSSKYLPTAIGAVLVRAWAEVSSANGADSDPNGSAEKSTGGTPAAVLIEDNVQQLLQEAVHLREQKTFSCFRSLLRAFHDVRRSVEIDAMLFRIYDPIIWRSLRCANASVRANASVLFLDIFPLQSSGGNAEQDERILQKQFDLLSTLLTDSDQRVRALTALGVCHILTEYWDVLPTATTHNLLKYLVDTLAVDASCATVRLAVFQGLEVLLQQPLAHEVVKNLLPLLRNTIHDKSEKVRVAFIRILCQVREI